MSTWQPIETAPKDGARILMTDGEDISIGSWDKLGWDNEQLQYGGDGGSAYPTFWIDPSPSHWMPLPEQPTE